MVLALIQPVHIDIFVDGSCLGNGRAGAQAGYGLHAVAPERITNLCGRVLGVEQTNNVGELAAIYAAIEYINKNPDQWGLDYTIHTDSEYALKCLETYAAEWQRGNWATAQDEPVKNGRLIKLVVAELKKCREKCPVLLKHVRGHAQSAGNIEADRLAAKGARGVGRHDVDFSRGLLTDLTVFASTAMYQDKLGISVFFGTLDKRNVLRYATGESRRYLAGEIQAVLLALRYFQDNSMDYKSTGRIKVVVGSEEVLKKITLARTDWPQNGWMVRGKPLAYEAPTFRQLYRQICSLQSLGFSLQFVYLPEQHERAAQEECIGNAQGVARYRCNAPLITLMSPN